MMKLKLLAGYTSAGDGFAQSASAAGALVGYAYGSDVKVTPSWPIVVAVKNNAPGLATNPFGR